MYFADNFFCYFMLYALAIKSQKKLREFNCYGRRLVSIVVYRGAFNNYVDKILHNFDPSLPPRVVIPTFCHVNKRGLSADPLPPLLVHVVIECPHMGNMQNVTSIHIFTRLKFLFLLYFCLK